MKYKKTFFGKGLLLMLSLCCLSCYSQKKERLAYPSTIKEVQTKTYHGESVTDEFSWLGDATTERTKKWAADQDTLMRSYVRSWEGYKQLKGKVQTLLSVSGRSELPMMSIDKTFYLKDSEKRTWDFYVNENGQERAIFGDAPPFNPRAFYFYLPSPNGKYVAMAVAGRYFEWKILDVETGKLLEETLPGRDMGGTRLAWSRDSKSFYYVGNTNTADDGSRSGFAIKQHTPGQPSDDDKVVFKPANDGSKLELSVCKGGDYLVIAEREGAATPSKIHYMLTKSNKVTPLIEEATSSFIFLGNDGKNFYFQTDNNAPKGRVVSINIDRSDASNWKELIPEQKKPVMGYQSAGGTFLPLIAGNKFVIPYQENLRQYLGVFSLSGNMEREIELPSGGLYFNTNGLSALSGIRQSSKVLTRFIGITEPNTILEIDVNTGDVKPFSRAKTNFDASLYVTEIVFSTSKDGTKVPISLTYKKGLQKNGKAPLLMQVYGAIAFTNYPYFQGDYITWLEMGGIHGVAHIRGGGALGSGWHQAGIARNKQTGIDDYISAIEYVADNKYTSASKTVINGVSAGTIPVAGVLTQKPQLIGSAVLHYGMMDMVSYAETFGQDANHGYMIPEIGSASVKEDFDAIIKYSPYQKLSSSICYPPVLALTSEADTPMDTDSYRFIAALQNLSMTCKSEYLLQMAWGSGHSTFGSQTHSPVDTFTDEIAFLIKSMNLNVDDWLTE
ncbi:MAG: prolyl oligopeptidase family serine peptidase [Cyclobacteriaceae bacterium]